MDLNEKPGNYAAWSQIIAVILLTAGAIWVWLPIKGERPAPSGLGIKSTGVQDVDARLWQDSFGAMQKTIEREKTEKPEDKQKDLKWLGTLIAQRFKQGMQVKIMLVLVPGGNWVGSDEFRRRSRYAVLAGLHEKRYVPLDPEHIGYVEEKNVHGVHMLFPFEMFTYEDDNGKSSYVLVLWVDDDALLQELMPNSSQEKEACLEPCPLARLSEIRKRLMDGCRDHPGVSCVVVGPSSSTFLKFAAQEINSSRIPDNLPGPWYSRFATVPDSELKLDKEKCEGLPVTEVLPPGFTAAQEIGLFRIMPQWLEENLPWPWYAPFATMPDSELKLDLPEFNRMIADDDMLANALVKELCLRRFGQGKAVALVGQWDTDYSRTLTRLLKEKIEK